MNETLPVSRERLLALGAAQAMAVLSIRENYPGALPELARRRFALETVIERHHHVFSN